MTTKSRPRTGRRSKPSGRGAVRSRSAKPQVRRKRLPSGRSLPVYLALVEKFPLVSIRSEEQLEAAQEVIDELFGRGEPDDETALYLDALGDLVAAYEDVHHQIGPATDSDMLRHLMEGKGVSQAELHKATGVPKSSISEVLSGKKPFSRSLIRAFAGFFEVDATVLTANLAAQ